MVVEGCRFSLDSFLRLHGLNPRNYHQMLSFLDSTLPKVNSALDQQALRILFSAASRFHHKVEAISCEAGVHRKSQTSILEGLERVVKAASRIKVVKTYG